MSTLTYSQKNWIAIGLAVVTIACAILIHTKLRQMTAKQEEERKAIVCPSLLSIARSSRDTLIVMKNEPLCTTFVLDNLQ